jgi:hypothetical protein
MQGKVKPTNNAPAVYAGIDVSKDWLDVYVHPAGMSWRVANTLDGLRQLRRRLAGVELAQVVLEATGKYHRPAHRTLSGWGYRVAVVNPLRARLFAEACGVLAKTDRIDARLLALLGQSLAPTPTAPSSGQPQDPPRPARGRDRAAHPVGPRARRTLRHPALDPRHRSYRRRCAARRPGRTGPLLG